jgi:capsular exopolysaccharide synthesis family protein
MQIDRLPLRDSDTAGRPADALSEQLRFWRRAIEKKLWVILLLTLLVGAIATLVAYSLTPIYRSTATLYIEPNKSKVVSIEEVYGGISGNREHIQTQLEILKSRELAEKLVKRLKLTTDPAIDPRQKPPELNLPIHWRDWIPAGWLPEQPPLSEEALTAAAIGEVQRDLDVQLVRLSLLINVSFESTDKTLAAKLANTMADVYIENDLESRLQMTQHASSWLAERIKGLRANLDASDRALQQFRDKERIVDTKGVALGISGQLTTETTAMVAAHQKVAELENAYRQVQAVLKGESRAKLDSIPAVLRSPSVIPLKTAEAEAERKLAELNNRYGANHPKIIAAESDLRAAQENTQKVVDSVVASITREYEVAKATEQSMQKSLDRSKTEIQDMSRKEFQLASLERDVQTNRQLYDLFVNRAKETGATSDLQSAIARVIDPAIVPGAPIKPQKTRMISISLLMGLMLGIVLALLLEYLDNTVRSGEDVATKLGVPMLGILPWVPGKHRKFEVQRAILENFNPAFSEAVRTLRTGLMMSALDNPHKVVLITSSVPEEGKTSVATNLAFALAPVKRTCLIDADMRRPSIYKVLAGELNMPGLSNLVADTEPVSKCVYAHASGLFYIPSGPVPPNPSELLSSKRFADVVHKLESMFDVILIDSPPVQLVSDTMILAGVANALVFVVRADSTPYQVSKGALEQLKRGKAKLLGVVLNRLDVEKSERHYGYGKYFSYGGKYEHYKHYGYYGGKKK